MSFTSTDSFDDKNHHGRFTRIDLGPKTSFPATTFKDASPTKESLDTADPLKYSPPSPGFLSKFPVKAYNFVPSLTSTRMDAYPDHRETRMQDFRHQEASRGSGYGNDHGPRYITKGIPQSLSEGGLNFPRSQKNQGSLPLKYTGLASNDIRIYPNEDSTYSSASSSSRGRSALRTPSPVKDLEIIKEVPSSEERSKSPFKRSRSPVKQLFGENGWLGKTMEKESKEDSRKNGLKHWGDKIKQRVDHLTEDMHKIEMGKFLPSGVQISTSPPKSTLTPKTRFSVSLSPPQQAQLYSELELMICATANDFLTVQQREGRMSVDSLTKTLQTWASKHRPQVLEFMFDQSTQRDLVVYNLKTFRFFGPNAHNIVTLNSMMHAWKAMAREMGVRTFCSPDSVIVKHLFDCHIILEMLGAPGVTLAALSSIRERAGKLLALGRLRRAEVERIEWGVERRWEPSRLDKEAEDWDVFVG